MVALMYAILSPNARVAPRLPAHSPGKGACVARPAPTGQGLPGLDRHSGLPTGPEIQRRPA